MKKIDWLNHSLEFVVVLIGIVIAFQMNKCSENNQKENLLANHLDYILLECQDNSSRLEKAILHSSAQLGFCDSLLFHITTSKNLNQIRYFSTKLLDMRNVDLIDNAYEVLSQSGDIRFFNHFEQKKAIIILYDRFEHVKEVNKNHQKLYDNHFYPYLKENFDLVNWGKVNITTEEEAIKYYAPEFANTISTYKFLLASKVSTYKEEKNIIDAYVKANRK